MMRGKRERLSQNKYSYVLTLDRMLKFHVRSRFNFLALVGRSRSLAPSRRRFLSIIHRSGQSDIAKWVEPIKAYVPSSGNIKPGYVEGYTLFSLSRLNMVCNITASWQIHFD